MAATWAVFDPSKSFLSEDRFARTPAVTMICASPGCHSDKAASNTGESPSVA
jgi:hypothetical protein